MSSFKDASQRTWLVAIDAYKIKRIRADLGFDIAVLDGTAYTSLCNDPVLFVDVLWVLCEKQIADLKLTPEDFAAVVFGDTYGRAKEAVLDATVDFSPDQNTRDCLRATAAATDLERITVMGELLTRVEDPSLRARIAAAAGAKMDEALAKAGIPSSSASSLPASAELAPAT